MQAEEFLRQGELDEALQVLQTAVRSEPSNAKLRVFLFQLLCVLGEWERALTQLQVAGELDAVNLAMVQSYREVLHCELFRLQVFEGDKSPLVFGDPPQWVAFLIEALHRLREGDYAGSRTLRDQAFDQAPATTGDIDGKAFHWIADADTRIGPLLEAVVNGRYYWIPMQRLARVDIEPPTDLRDMVWIPAHLTFANQGETVAFIPARYPGSEKSPDPSVRLSRRTEWEQPAEGVFVGTGQRMFATDSNEHPLLGTRRIQLESDDVDRSG